MVYSPLFLLSSDEDPLRVVLEIGSAANEATFLEASVEHSVRKAVLFAGEDKEIGRVVPVAGSGGVAIIRIKHSGNEKSLYRSFFPIFCSCP